MEKYERTIRISRANALMAIQEYYDVSGFEDLSKAEYGTLYYAESGAPGVHKFFRTLTSYGFIKKQLLIY